MTKLDEIKKRLKNGSNAYYGLDEDVWWLITRVEELQQECNQHDEEIGNMKLRVSRLVHNYEENKKLKARVEELEKENSMLRKVMPLGMTFPLVNK